MLTATFLRNLSGFRGDARLYRLSSPILGDGPETDHVIVSAVDALGAPETYIFPADAEGEILSWSELPGSFQGACDHAKAIADAGWTLISQA